jgi:hypothetical protein
MTANQELNLAAVVDEVEQQEAGYTIDDFLPERATKAKTPKAVTIAAFKKAYKEKYRAVLIGVAGFLQIFRRTSTVDIVTQTIAFLDLMTGYEG